MFPLLREFDWANLAKGRVGLIPDQPRLSGNIRTSRGFVGGRDGV